ncbi:MAG: alpha/beta fold hydrolase [Methylococcaceae bacterium]|nr:alpha/beta fold hydrolase [Methylococcaceae bacterium]
MGNNLYEDHWPDIDTALYNRSAKLFNAVKNILGVKLALHADPQILQGDIFLFNHFSRFETFIPQLLIYEKTGAYSCAIAAGEFFKEDTVLSRYLKHVGVFPHDHQRLFAQLAAQILRGRKVIIFPEGGMVKDHRVIDKQGQYSIFSRITGNRRKQHTGAAILGQGVEAFKAAIRYAHQQENEELLLRWKEELHFDNFDQLLASANKPTRIVPANITFYPIRASENLLFKSVELFSENLSLRQTEELLIEGNIILKNTDMDIRMGSLVNPCCVWDWRTHYLMSRVAPQIKSVDDVFALRDSNKTWSQRLLGRYFVNNADCARDQYMKEMYSNLTVNLSHLASTLIMHFLSQGQTLVDKNLFYSVLYIAIKRLQVSSDVHLHRSLLNPDDYSDLLKLCNRRFDYFIHAAIDAELIQDKGNSYQFLPKLRADFDFDSIRLENPIAVYYYEAEPIHLIRDILVSAIDEFAIINPRQLAVWHFDDEFRSLALEKKFYTKPQFNEINQQETATADSSPFFIRPEQVNNVGVLLVHGLLASPAELRDYANYLAGQGYTVLAVRLKGHGTSPYALRDQRWEDWFGSVQRGLHILKAYCARVVAIGFSTGGALALTLAAEDHPELLGVVAVSVPLKFVNSSFMLVPLLHGTNKLVGWVSTFEGVKPFIDNLSEHPDINYRNTSVRALYELRLLIAHVEDQILPRIKLPVLVVYADQDPVVDAKCAKNVFDKLGSTTKQLKKIKSDRHGILMENLGNTWGVIDEFIVKLIEQSEQPACIDYGFASHPAKSQKTSRGLSHE